MALITRGNNMRLLRGGRVQALIMQGRLRDSVFSPADLFASGEQGAWYDPSDLSSMFQDAAGTTPAALEQPVGLLLDKSGGGNHASQTTLAARPVLSARYNLLTYTEDFSNAAWSKLTYATVSTNTTVAPDGTTTADTISETTTISAHSLFYTNTVVAGTTFKYSCYLKAGSVNFAQLNIGSNDATRWIQCVVNLATGEITQSSAGAGGTLVSAISTAASNGFYQVTLTGSIAVETTLYTYIGTVTSGTPTLGNFGVQARAGNVSNNIIAWGADFRGANDGVGLPAYQRVGAATAGSSTVGGTADYDSAGFPTYLRFDGIDDCLFTSAINFTATDKMTVWAGVRVLTNAIGAVYANTNQIATGNGQILALLPLSSTTEFYVRSRGTLASNISVDDNNYIPPKTLTFTQSAEISTDTNILRVNGASFASSNENQGTGNYANAVLGIGSRIDATDRFNGRIYSLIVCGAQSTDTQITQTENWVNQKTRAY